MSAILHSIVVSIENDRISNLLNEWRINFDIWCNDYCRLCKCDKHKMDGYNMWERDFYGVCKDCFYKHKWECDNCRIKILGYNLQIYYDEDPFPSWICPTC